MFEQMIGEIVDQMAWMAGDDYMHISWWGCGGNAIWVVVHIDE